MTAREFGERLARSAGPLTDEQVEAAARILATVVNELAGLRNDPAPAPSAQPKMITPRLLPYAEAATYLGISLRGMKKLAAAGEINKTQIGSRVLFDREDLDRFVDRLK